MHCSHKQICKLNIINPPYRLNRIICHYTKRIIRLLSNVLGHCYSSLQDFTTVTRSPTSYGTDSAVSQSKPIVQEKKSPTMVKDAIVMEPSGEHKATIIFSHGLGDSGHGWAPVMKMIKHPNVKYILPHAPTEPVTLNGGMAMPSWFDIFGLSATSKEDAPGIKRSAARLITIVEEEIAGGLPSDKIILGGFSQGGAISLYAGLTYDKPLAAICCLSTWLPLNAEFPAGLKEANKKTPIFQAHGDSDQVVSFNWGRGTHTKLDEWGYNSTWQVYPGMGHSTCPQELNDFRVFLSQFY